MIGTRLISGGAGEGQYRKEGAAVSRRGKDSLTDRTRARAVTLTPALHIFLPPCSHGTRHTPVPEPPGYVAILPRGPPSL